MGPNEVDNIINYGVFECIDYLNRVIIDGEKLLPRHFNPRCMVFVAPGNYHCRKINNVDISPDKLLLQCLTRSTHPNWFSESNICQQY